MPYISTKSEPATQAKATTFLLGHHCGDIPGLNGSLDWLVLVLVHRHVGSVGRHHAGVDTQLDDGLLRRCLELLHSLSSFPVLQQALGSQVVDHGHGEGARLFLRWLGNLERNGVFNGLAQNHAPQGCRAFDCRLNKGRLSRAAYDAVDHSLVSIEDGGEFRWGLQDLVASWQFKLCLEISDGGLQGPFQAADHLVERKWVVV